MTILVENTYSTHKQLQMDYVVPMSKLTEGARNNVYSYKLLTRIIE